MRVKNLEPLHIRLREFSGAMRESKAVKLGSQKAGVEETMRNEDPGMRVEPLGQQPSILGDVLGCVDLSRCVKVKIVEEEAEGGDVGITKEVADRMNLKDKEKVEVYGKS